MPKKVLSAKIFFHERSIAARRIMSIKAGWWTR